MTERGKRSLSRSTDQFGLGRSRLDWRGDRLSITVDEQTIPSMKALRGEITLTPQRGGGPEVALDQAARHVWRPIAPDCAAKVKLEAPDQSWSGHGYIDSNYGARPIAQDFIGWDWSRTCGAEPRAFYELTTRDGMTRNFGAAFATDGSFGITDPTPHRAGPSSFWRVPRRLPGEIGVMAGTLEDTPFYARSLAHVRIGGNEMTLIHERLDCDRLASRWVQALLPFRMPRED